MRRLTLLTFVAILGLAFMVTGASDERTGPREMQDAALLSAFDGDDDDDDDSATRPFQLAFISRVDTEAFQVDGTSLLLGHAESLQARVPGVRLGDFEEVIGALCEEVEGLPECPVPGSCVPICDTVMTRRGSLTYQGLVYVVQQAPNGPFPTSSIYGEIISGDGFYSGATGTMNLDGQINICTTPGDGLGCAASDAVPEELGLSYDCNFVLRGQIPRRRH